MPVKVTMETIVQGRLNLLIFTYISFTINLDSQKEEIWQNFIMEANNFKLFSDIRPFSFLSHLFAVSILRMCVQKTINIPTLRSLISIMLGLLQIGGTDSQY